MIEKKITIGETEYTKMNKIRGNKKTYIEYRNEDIRKIKFFEADKGILREISDKKDLKEAIEKNYIIK